MQALDHLCAHEVSDQTREGEGMGPGEGGHRDGQLGRMREGRGGAHEKIMFGRARMGFIFLILSPSRLYLLILLRKKGVVDGQGKEKW